MVVGSLLAGLSRCNGRAPRQTLTPNPSPCRGERGVLQAWRVAVEAAFRHSQSREADVYALLLLRDASQPRRAPLRRYLACARGEGFLLAWQAQHHGPVVAKRS